MKMRLFIGCMCLGIAFSLPAAAGFYTGHQLLQVCERGAGQPSSECMWYIAGIADGWEMGRVQARKPQCLPDGTTIRQIADLAVKFLRDYPAFRDESASDLVVTAMVEAWKCQR
jgi:hypothetical protein